MSRFLQKPHLPQGNVACVAVGEDCAPLLAPALKGFGVRILACPANPGVDVRLRSHIDLSVLHLGGPRFILAAHLRKTDFAKELSALGAEIIFAEDGEGAAYPADARLCALLLGERLFHVPKITDRAVLKAGGFRQVSVRQGYAKCAVCPVPANAAITADRGMARALMEEGIEVLKIESGGVSLSGFDEGFFGGAAFLLAPDTLAVTGRLDALPDRESIELFLGKCGVRTVFLTDRPIFDIGSAVPVLEM